MMKLVHQFGCPWEEDLSEFKGNGTAEMAGTLGNLQVLKFVHEKGCKWKDSLVEKIAFKGHVECLEYVIDHGCGCVEGTTKIKSLVGYHAITSAIKAGNKSVLEYLQSKGCVESWYNQVQREDPHANQLVQLKYAQSIAYPELADKMQRCIEYLERHVKKCVVKILHNPNLIKITRVAQRKSKFQSMEFF